MAQTIIELSSVYVPSDQVLPQEAAQDVAVDAAHFLLRNFNETVLPLEVII